MLSRITIENFKCFKEKTVIELHKDDNYTILPQNVSSGGILKGLVFVGGNGSGKSTILEALKLFLNLLFDENHIQMCFYECLLSETREFCITYEFLVQSQEILRMLYFNGRLLKDSLLTIWMDYLKSSRYVSAAPVTLDAQEFVGETQAYYEQGGLLLIDEFSSGLHNELMNILITYFMKHAKGAQILIVSHGTNILSNSILRPDQEYSVEFYGTAGSRNHRFSRERPRNSQNIPKMYNSGIFGGKPVYGEAT